MWANDFGISEKILADAGLNDEEKAAFLEGKLNKIIVSKILKVNGIGSDEVDDLTLGKQVLDFLSENNLQSTYIDGYFKKLSSNAPAKDIGNLKELKEELKKLQRLCHLVPRGARTLSSDSGSLQDSNIFLKLWMLPHLRKLNVTKSEAGSYQIIPPDVNSAHSVKRMGRKTWLKKYANYLGGEAVANEIYDNAARISAHTMVLLSSYLDQKNSPMYVLPALDAADIAPNLSGSDSVSDSELPTWKELFGSLDFCQCEHCNSVYGPASYFVDLLHFLDTCGNVYNFEYVFSWAKIQGTDGTQLLKVLRDRYQIDWVLNARIDKSEDDKIINLSQEDKTLTLTLNNYKSEVILKIGNTETDKFIAKEDNGELKIYKKVSDTKRTTLDVLFDRRQDLGNIRLNCPNTETPMPYIDLINEILESAVVGNLDFSYQTTRTPEELKMSPENIKSEAYNKLTQAIYPFDLPFDLWSMQADAYLEKIGFQRYQIMRTMQSDKGPSDIDIAATHIGLTPVDLNIITGKDVSQITGKKAEIYDFWGVNAKGFNKLKGDNNLGMLLKQSNLSFEEFSSIIDTKFIFPESERSRESKKIEINIVFSRVSEK